MSDAREDVSSVDERPPPKATTERLLAEFGLESRQVAPPTDVGAADRSLAEFVAGDGDGKE
jgi:hypothetical protein